MPLLSFTSRRSSKASLHTSSEPNQSSSKWDLLRQSIRTPALSPLPKAITDQISTEIYELIIDHLRYTPALLACNLVCRSWAPRCKHLLLERMVCHPIPLVAHGGFGSITCAVPDPGGNGGIIYVPKDGIYRGTTNGARRRLLFLHDVSQIDLLPDSNLVICLAGGTFMTMSLSSLNSGTLQDVHRISKHVSCFTVYRSTVVGERHRVCALKTSALSSTIKVYDVSGNNTVSTLVNAMELYIPLETYSVKFLSRTRLVAAIKIISTVRGGFELIDLVTAETQSLLEPDDPSHLHLSLKKAKPITVFRVDTIFLLCYDKLAFYIDRRGNMTRNEIVMRWAQSANAFGKLYYIFLFIMINVVIVLHMPYILAFCDARVEVWNIETGKMVQKIPGPYYLLSSPDLGERVLSLSLSSGDVTEIAFQKRAVPSL
ncbi:Sulfhydryl oxidase [Mycena sanguinolenta]|uniref:Sulfhydryl oxidase n=1 Tax=Mycena sanguinolenta TaxID=230812 RepID=A0A8H7DCC9_9AGAR|nr:Sulfhydryl oxidase [Mycena sanguinolenta]